jgi:hypothetical protein
VYVLEYKKSVGEAVRHSCQTFDGPTDLTESDLMDAVNFALVGDGKEVVVY